MVVQRAQLPPGKCIVTHDIDGPFLDCGIEYEVAGYFNRLYLHLPWIEEMGRKHLGMVPASALEDKDTEIEELKDELLALEMAIDALSDAKAPA